MAEMLQCMAGSVLERQRAQFQWHHDHQEQQQQQNKSFNYTTEQSFQSSYDFQPGTNPDISWPDLPASAAYRMPGVETIGFGCPPNPSPKQSSSSTSSLKKRKLAEDCNAEKRSKTAGEEPVSKSEEPIAKKPNSKALTAVAAPKTDYIHVRARRGQATDSHSLAERVRREKISERMKYLQDLVPGCDKITGKAGMLDEIINYVQSLQRQVEFLSMKLAAVTPRIEFNMDGFFGKEMNPSCSTSLSTVAMSSEMMEPSYLQLNSLQQAAAAAACCGINMTVTSPEHTLRKSVSAPVSLPETFLDPCFNVQGTSTSWETDLQGLYNVEFQQGRGAAFPLQSFQGNVLPNNLKTEM